MLNPDIQNLIERRDRALEAFATLGDLRPGSLVENYRKCGKPNCHCAREGGKKHMSYLLVRTVDGNHKSVHVKAYQIARISEETQEYQRFREISREFLEASEELSRARQKIGEDQKKTPISATRSARRSQRKRRG